MPIYEFRCGSCDARFEALVDAGTETTPCGACGAEATRVLSAPAAPFHLVKGGAETRRQERRNARLRERTRADFKAARRRAGDARDGGNA